MSYLLELLGRGLDNDLGDVLDRYFWSPSGQSLDQLKEQVAAHPKWPDAWCRVGVAYLRALHVPKAIEHLSEACRRKPDYVAARLALAAAHDEQGHPDRAMEHLKIANLNSPGQVRILFALGYCCEKLQHPETAAEYYRDAARADGNFLGARERLAAVAVALGRTGEAIEQYEHLRQMWPEKAWIIAALGQLHYREGRFDEAADCFETAIAMEPENWSLLDDQVESLVAGGHIRQAIERLNRLIEQQPTFPDLHVRLGDLYSHIGNDPAAMTHYGEALDIEPDYLEAVVKTGTQHLMSGRWEQAAEAFCRACELNDRVLTNYVGMGVAQLAAGRTEQAAESFELAATIEPNSGMLLSEMARLQLKTAVADEFLKGFEQDASTPVAEIELDNDDLLHKQIDRHKRIVDQRPGHADLRYRYGVLLRSQGRLGEALEQFERAAAINPTYVQAIIKLGITQQEMGQVDRAVDTFRRALEIEPEYVDVHYRLGLLYTDRRLFDQAVRHMEAAAGGEPGNARLRAGLALALQNMGLMDRAAATWRSLWRIHQEQTES